VNEVKKQLFRFRDNPNHPIWDSLDDEEPQFAKGVCKYCGETKENCRNYKCWR